MVQILYKTLFGIGVIRLNRGPLLIKKNDYLSKLIIHKIKKDLYKNKIFQVIILLELTEK